MLLQAINPCNDWRRKVAKINQRGRLFDIKIYIKNKSSAGSVLDNTITYIYDANGNLIRTQDTDTNVDTYEYYTNLIYAPPLVTGPLTAESTKKKTLVKTHTLTSNGSLVGSAGYTYTFDDKDRISTETAVLSDGSITTKTYTY